MCSSRDNLSALPTPTAKELRATTSSFWVALLSEDIGDSGDEGASWRVKYLASFRPNLSLGGGIRKRYLAGIGFLPPAASLGICSHFFHVCCKIVARVFEVGKKEELPVDFLECDGVVLDVALPDHAENAGPSCRVQPKVVFGFFQAEPGYGLHPLHVVRRGGPGRLLTRNIWRNLSEESEQERSLEE